MIKKIKNIFNLSKIFFKNNFQNPYLIDKETNKINWKSPFVWLLIILIIAITYLSMQIIKVLIQINQEVIFLNVFFLILMIIMAFQIILASTNVYFFSKDFETVLPLPIKSEELLISKFNTTLINVYLSEIIFALLPLLIYGIYTNSGFMYYLYMILIILIFPILINLIISSLMMCLIKLTKFIKNKDILQVFLTLLFLIFIFILEFKIGNNLIEKIGDNFDLKNTEIINEISYFKEKLKNINNYFLIINPSVEILNNYNKINSIFNLFKIIFINLIFFILFIFIGKKYYLKNILKNNNNYYLKNNKKIIKNKFKKKKIYESYIEKEFKLLFKNPTFFMQCIFPVLILMISLSIICIIFAPNIRKLIESDFFAEQNIEISMGLGVICTILALIQIIFTLLNISISAISREGKNAIYLKFIPIDFYKQFIYKSMPQIIFNMFLILIILIIIKIVFPAFELIYLLFLFIGANLLNILNSELMVLVDFIKPNLNWNADYEAIKNNNNKLYQYVLSIIVVLFIKYLYEIFKDFNLILANILILFIFLIIIFIINLLIKKNINKLFKKIN